MAEEKKELVIEDIVSVKSKFLKDLLSTVIRKTIKKKLGLDIYSLNIEELNLHTTNTSGAVSGELKCNFLIGKAGITKLVE